ncbi:hypothetical protein RFI_32359, partial [Reticulomyxa filosa]
MDFGDQSENIDNNAHLAILDGYVKRYYYHYVRLQLSSSSLATPCNLALSAGFSKLSFFLFLAFLGSIYAFLHVVAHTFLLYSFGGTLKKKRINTPAYVDYINIKSEVKKVLYWLLFLGTTFAIYTIISLIDVDYKYLSYFWYLSIFQPLFCIGDLGCIMTMTYGVLKSEKLLRFMKSYRGEIRHLSSFALYANDKQNATRHNLTVQHQIFKQAPPRQHNDEKDHHEKFINHLGLEDFLSEIHRLEVLMDFLFGEFCQENLLAIIEFMQFKNSLAVKNENGEDINVVLPPEVVKSEIVFDADLTPQQKFKFLVEKYV